MEITVKSIYLNCKAETKKEAVEEVGWLLVENGNIKGDYIESMHEREGVSNTFLGNGIAIPHGMQKDREHINKTGIAVLQIRDGVEWNPGEKVSLVFGIAAKSDEHIEILGNLTGLVTDEKTVEKLTGTDNPEDIINALKSKKTKKSSDKIKLKKGERFAEAVVCEKTGLHARPASVFVEMARKYDAVIKLQKVGEEDIVEANSMASILSLRIKKDDSVRIIASGKDSDIALKELKEAVDNGLVEEDEEEVPIGNETLWTPESVEKEFVGVAASLGIEIAPAQVFIRKEIELSEKASESDIELNKLENSIDKALKNLDEIYLEVVEKSGAGKAAIFKAHAEFLKDPEIIEFAKNEIKAGFSAEWSWRKAFENKAVETENLDDPLLSARAIDIRDVGCRVLKLLVPGLEENSIKLDNKTILIADELTPSETVGLDTKKILGICTAKGGALSHTAIIARSLGIPAVVGAGDDVLKIENGKILVIDGSAGKLYVEPSENDIKKVAEIQKRLEELANLEYSERFQPAITKDGHRIEIAANIGNTADSEKVLENGGEGVGLFRTEFLFLERDAAPTEEEQIKVYSDIVRNLNGLPLTLRTLDVGGDKQIQYLSSVKEDNPFLGVRGIRLCLKNLELFKEQIRAVLKASELGSIRLMFPMVSKVNEIKYVKSLIDEMKKNYDVKDLQIGIMIEVPSAVIMADAFANHVDFFSIGTNDLTQYTLAMDRGNTELAKEAQGLDPAVLRMIKLTVDAAHKKGKWVGVCGDLAGDPKAAYILAGLGVDELSMNIPSIPNIKKMFRDCKYSDAENISEKALKCETFEEVKRLLK